MSSRMSVCSVVSPAVSTMISSGRPSDGRRMPSEPFFRPISSSRLVGRLAVELGPQGLVVLLVQRAVVDDRVVARIGQAEIQDLIDLLAVDGRGQGAAETHVPEQLPPGRIVDVQVGEERELRTPGGAPQQRAVVAVVSPFFRKVGLLNGCRAPAGRTHPSPPWPGSTCHRPPASPRGRCRALAAGRVDPVEVGIAHPDEPVGGQLGRVDPGLQARQVRVVVVVHALSSRLWMAAHVRLPGSVFSVGHLRVVPLVELLEVVPGRKMNSGDGEAMRARNSGLGLSQLYHTVTLSMNSTFGGWPATSRSAGGPDGLRSRLLATSSQ